MQRIKFPEIEVMLSSERGNAFGVIWIVDDEMRKHDVSREDRDSFIVEATRSGSDYEKMIRVVETWVTVKTF